MEILGRNVFRSVIFLLICFATTNTFGQSFQRLSYPFLNNNQVLKNALTGGMNAPQFNSVDFNQDGKKDLVVFDREGNVLLPFKNIGTQGEINFEFAPDYIDNFPVINSWMLLRDFNGDGIEDIFTYPSFLGISGVEVYKGFVLNGQVGYERVLFPNEQYDLLYFNLL
ncbi:MAG: VCBS repeat-containing protein, partial [Saprospiraceae bacterium]|nr:VCBS repeat-containing protein [Saprospiraceae bacterium]